MKQLIISILILLGMGFSQEPLPYDLSSLLEVEIVPYRIYPSSHPSMGCWSRLEMIGHQESRMNAETRDKLIDKIIKIELYNEISEYITIEIDGIDKEYYFESNLNLIVHSDNIKLDVNIDNLKQLTIMGG